MYGVIVYVRYKGKLEEVMVPCEPRTAYEELQEIALNTLRERDEKKLAEKQTYVWKNLERIVSMQWNK